MAAGEGGEGRVTHVDTALLQVNDQLGHVDVGGELIREGLVALAEAAIGGRGDVNDGVSRALGAVVPTVEGRADEYALHAYELSLGALAKVVPGEVDDGGVLAAGVLHAVAVLVANTLDAEGPAAGDADVEDDIVAVLWGWRDDHFRVDRSGEDGRATVEAGDGGEDGLVGDWDLEGGDMDLLGT